MLVQMNRFSAVSCRIDYSAQHGRITLVRLSTSGGWLRESFNQNQIVPSPNPRWGVGGRASTTVVQCSACSTVQYNAV